MAALKHVPAEAADVEPDQISHDVIVVAALKEVEPLRLGGLGQVIHDVIVVAALKLGGHE